MHPARSVHPPLSRQVPRSGEQHPQHHGTDADQPVRVPPNRLPDLSRDARPQCPQDEGRSAPRCAALCMLANASTLPWLTK